MQNRFMFTAFASLLLVSLSPAEPTRMTTLDAFREAIFRDDATTLAPLLAAEPELLKAPIPDAASCLHLAARHDSANAARVLVKAGADLYARDDGTQLALDIPPGQALNSTRKLLREVNQSRNEFLGAVSKRDTERVKAMLGADPSLAQSRDIGDGWSAIMMACHFGDAATLKVLLNANAVAGFDFHTQHDAFTVCALSGNAECLKLLLAKPYDPAASWRVQYGQLPMMMNALHIACWKGHTEVVKLLLDTRKFSTNDRARSYAMFTPLHFAATEGHTEILKLLLAAGADRTALDGRRGITALQMAQAGKHEAAIQTLAGK